MAFCAPSSFLRSERVFTLCHCHFPLLFLLWLFSSPHETWFLVMLLSFLQSISRTISCGFFSELSLPLPIPECSLVLIVLPLLSYLDVLQFRNVLFFSFFLIGRDGAGNDPCNQPGNGHVLGHLTLELHGDHGRSCEHKPLHFTVSEGRGPDCISGKLQATTQVLSQRRTFVGRYGDES